MMNATASDASMAAEAPDRDRPHVGPHQPGDERHRQDGGDDGEGGEDGRIADLVHALDRRDVGRAVAHLEVAVDVLDHHDGVVHQDADGEDQREEGDPVERVAQRVVDEERERQRDRDRDQHHQRLAPAEEDPDEHRDRERRDEQVEHQLVGLLARGLAVVAGDVHLHVGGEEPAPCLLHARQRGVRDVGGVDARPLGHGDGDGLFAALPARRVRHVVGGLGGRLDDGGHVPEVDRPGAVGDDDVAGIARGADRRADRHEEDLVGRGELAGREPHVGGAECLHDLAGRHAARRPDARDRA